MTEPKINTLYKHYKGGLYKVLHIAYDETNLEPTVIYQAQYDTDDLGEKPIFTRKVSIWNETVEVNNEKVLRFAPVEFDTLQFITGNANKVKEARVSIPNLQQLKLDLDEIQSLDYKEVINHKLAQAKQMGYRNFFVEDVSLTIENIGFPGPLIKWVNQTIGDNLGTLYKNEPTTVICAIGYCDIDGNTQIIEGIVKGKMVVARGEDFGFNPIFLPEGETQTYAEMTLELKGKINHRAIALAKLKEIISSS